MDVLLSFGDECYESHNDGDDCERRRRIDFGGADGVVGLAVPAPLSLSTAVVVEASDVLLSFGDK